MTEPQTRYRIAIKYSDGWRWAYYWNGDMTLTWRTESEAITVIHNGFHIGGEYRIVPSNAAGEFVLPGDEPQADTPECLASGEDLIDYENEMRDKAAKESVEQPDPFVLDRDECTRASFDKAAQRVQIGWRMVAPSGVADPPGIALDQPEPVYRESSNPDDRIRELEATLTEAKAENERLKTSHEVWDEGLKQIIAACDQRIADLSMLLLASFQKPAYVNDGPEYWTDSEIDAALARLADERKERG